MPSVLQLTGLTIIVVALGLAFGAAAAIFVAGFFLFAVGVTLERGD